MEVGHAAPFRKVPTGVLMGGDSLSVKRTVQSLVDDVFQLLELTPSPGERYLLKLCDSEEFLRK